MTETTLQDRVHRGQQRRKEVPRTQHALWDAKLRKADPLRLLAQSMHGRVPKLVALKYERMAASPFGFFRGAVPIMAYDLSLLKNSGITAQLCGDAHVRNLGAYAGPDGKIVFDINDFDETIVDPFEWDVKRMATSLILAGRGAEMRASECRTAALVFLEQYRLTMQRLSRLPVLEMARYQVRRLKSVATVDGILRLAERSTPLHTLEQLTEVRTAQRGAGHKTEAKAEANRIFRTTPLLTRLTGTQSHQVIASLAEYSKTLQPERRVFLAQYRPVDVAFKVVGTGSVGLRDYCIYMEGNGPSDPLFLQIKEEAPSAYAPYAKAVPSLKAALPSEHQGRRVVNGERAMQLQSDPMLGWTSFDDRQYLVRQLNDHKASISLEDLDPAQLAGYAEVCGELLARGHARSGACMEIAGYIGRGVRFDNAVADFARAYADQTEADWKQLAARSKNNRSRKTSRASKKAPSKKAPDAAKQP